MSKLPKVQKVSLSLFAGIVVLVAYNEFFIDWSSVCEQARTAARESHGRSGALPAPPLDRSTRLGEFWVLDWAGVPVPIPAIDYDLVLMDHGAQPGLMEVTLQAENPPTKIELRWATPDREMMGYWPDAFDQYLSAVPDGREVFEQTFGDFFPTRGRWYARHHSLDDLTCEPSASQAELPLLLSLLAYTTEIAFGGDEKFDVVHPALLGGTAYPTSEGRWRVELLPHDASIPPAVITYQVGPDYAQIGHHVASAELKSAAEAPTWFGPVNDLLKGLNQARLDALLLAFNRSAVDPNSRLGLAELQRLISGEKQWDGTSPARTIEVRKKNEIVF